MSKDTLTHQLTETIEELSSAESLKGLFHQHRDGNPLPSGKALEEIISLSRSILFPGYFGNSSVNISTIKYHIGVRVEKLYEMLSEQILAGLCFANDCETETQAELQHQRAKAGVIAAKTIMEFPRLRKILATDVEAAYEGDPGCHEPRRNHLLLPGHQGGYQLPHRSRTARTGSAAHSENDD